MSELTKCSNYQTVKISTCNMLQHVPIRSLQFLKHAPHTKMLLPQLLRNKLSHMIDAITDNVRTVYMRWTNICPSCCGWMLRRWQCDKVIVNPWWWWEKAFSLFVFFFCVFLPFQIVLSFFRSFVLSFCFQALPPAWKPPSYPICSQVRLKYWASSHRRMHIFGRTREQVRSIRFSELTRVKLTNLYCRTLCGFQRGLAKGILRKHFT